ncbi:MAG: AAA family ATPase [Alphaproteobacteria bacterium]|nr:AAA family ATPase [Alphaproteobacteria bacterium]
MIKKIKLLQNIGQFDSVSLDDLSLEKLTVIYGENGCGKTTLAAVMHSLSTGDPGPINERERLASDHPPKVVVSCPEITPENLVFQDGQWNYRLPNLIVFDDAFVDRNVYSGLAVESSHRQNLHETVVGEQGVVLSQALQSKAEQIERHNSEIRNYENRISRTDLCGMSVDNFCALRQIPDIDRAIKGAEQNLAASDAQESIRNAQNFREFSLPEIEMEKISRVLEADIASLDTATVSRIQAHLRALGDGAETWVSEGMKYQESQVKEDSEKCAFCAQDLSGSPVFGYYRAYFSDEYKNHQKRIHQVLSEFTQMHSPDAVMSFERDAIAVEKNQQFWSKFTNLPALAMNYAAVSAAWVSARENVTKLLQKKRADPLAKLQVSDSARAAVAFYERCRVKVSALNQDITAANAAIQNVRGQVQSADSAQIKNTLGLLRATKARYAPEMASLCSAYLKVRGEKKNAENARDECRRQLDKYREDVFPAYQEAINRYLRKIDAGYHLEDFKSANIRGGSTCVYNVVVNDTPIPVTGGAQQPSMPFKTALSAGDRSALAFAFFLAKLECDQGKDNKIVVIDDPITSLDMHRISVTSQKLRGLAVQVQQVIILSHNNDFLCRVWNGAPKSVGRTSFCVARRAEKSIVSEWEVVQDTDHDRQHAILREYVQNGVQNETAVANAMRPVIEGFLRVAYPDHFRPGSMIRDFLGACEQRMGQNDQILSHEDLAELRQINEYTREFHHGSKSTTKVTINSGELLSFVKRVLSFVRRS